MKTRAFTFFSSLLLILIVIFTLAACDEEKEPTYYHKVYRENLNGSHTEWRITDGYSVDGSLVCWEAENGGDFCITGKITIVPLILEEPKVKEDEKEEKKE